ncbi:MAG: PHP domain-containing protein [Planctomycetes bacterium]|nr:PHP domain-containing protein [Planctomycetota bacterium]
MKIDIHMHTSERSPCGRNTEHEQIRSAIRHGLDAVMISDHNTLVPKSVLKELNRQYAPFRIFGGIEINADDEHILVAGVDVPCLEEAPWSYPELWSFVREKGGFLALAHPYRFHPLMIDVEKYPPHAIEVHSRNIRANMSEKIEELIATVGCWGICASDGHSEEDVGIYHLDLLDEPEDGKGLAKILKAGRFECCCDEERLDLFNGDLPPEARI